MNFTTNKNNDNDRPANKGFTVHVGESYVGFITITEFDRSGRRVMDEEMAKSLQDPNIMASVLGNAELRPYAEKGVAENSDLSALIAASTDKQESTEALEALI